MTKKLFFTAVCSALLTACTTAESLQPEPMQMQPDVEPSAEMAQLVVLDRFRADDYAIYDNEEGSYFWSKQAVSPFAIVMQSVSGNGLLVDVRKAGSRSRRFTVLFDTDSAKLSSKAKKVLREAARFYDDSPVTVAAYADKRHTKAYNQSLSERRAEAVAAYLRERGLNVGEVKGYGEKHQRPTYRESRRAVVKGNDHE